MAALSVASFLKALSSQSAATHSCCSGGNPRSGSPRSDDGDAICAVLPLVASFLEQLLDGGGLQWCGVHLPYHGWRVAAVFR
jgi:hypothetical protein